MYTHLTKDASVAGWPKEWEKKRVAGSPGTTMFQSQILNLNLTFWDITMTYLPWQEGSTYFI